VASTRTSHRATDPSSGRDGRRPVGAQRVLGVAAALTAAAAVLVVALAVGRAGTSSGTAGPVTGWGLPLARLALDVSALATIGLLLLGGFLLPAAGERLAGRGLSAVRTAAWWALAWAASAAVAGVLTLSDISGRPVGSVLNPLLLLDFVIEASQGRALLLVVGLALALAAFARRTRTVNDAWLLLVLAALTVVPPTLTGHAAESANHDLASLSLVLHVLAASAWVGGLGALVLYGTGAAPLREVAARYSQLALGCFALVGLSGVGNAAIRLSTGPDAVTQLWVSRYGWLVVAKAVALVVLGCFGWWHRKRTLPELTAGRAAAFTRFASVELVVMVLAVALAVALSRAPTPAPASPAASPVATPVASPVALAAGSGTALQPAR
jgi:putative copper export protein